MKRKKFVDVLSFEPKKCLLNGWCILATFVDGQGILHRYSFPFYKVHLLSKDGCNTNSYVIRGVLADDLFLNELDADYILDLLKNSYEEKTPSFLKMFGL